MNRRSQFRADIHFRVSRILQENPDLTHGELVERFGGSVGRLDYCLTAMIKKGLVKMKNFAHSKNKFGDISVLTPAGMTEKTAITHRFSQRKMEEREALLSAEIEAL
jgi:EPS-associated MarR family transcriptional regulator